MTGRPLAFYAPLKSPWSPVPSGDRTMARLVFRALASAGFAPELASELRSLDPRGDPSFQDQLQRRAWREADRIIAEYRQRSAAARPRLWFSYHVYYKAPDWIGPRVAEALSIPYVVAEASRAAKRATGPWALGHQGAEAALDRAAVIYVMTPADREALERGRVPGQQLVDCPPFTDLADWPPEAARRTASGRRPVPRLLTVAMMRSGDKLSSYRLLARALERLQGSAWTLDIVGDGEAREAVESEFRPLGERVRWHGAVHDRAMLRVLYEGADLFVWPAVNEAYGMALLEAQGFGCPVVAGAFGGVASVVRHGETGLLLPPGDTEGFAEAVAALIGDPARRQQHGAAARQFVLNERSLAVAAGRLRVPLEDLLAAGGAP